MASKESYIVGDVKVEFANKRKATLSRDELVINLESKDRHGLLVLVGETLDKHFKLDNSAIWGLYNVVKLR